MFPFWPEKDQDVGEALVKSLQNTKYSIDEKLEKSFITLFSRKPNNSSEAINDAKDAEEDSDHGHGMETDNQSETELNADRLGEEHAEDLDSSDSSDQDVGFQKGDLNKSASGGSDEDNLMEHVEFIGGRQRRKAIFQSDSDLKVFNGGW